MPGAIKRTAGRRQTHHSDSKSCSSEDRQTPNRELSTKSTPQKASTMPKSITAEAKTMPNSSQTKTLRNKPQSSTSVTTHGTKLSIDKLCTIEPTGDSVAALDGKVCSTRSTHESPVDRHAEGPTPLSSTSKSPYSSSPRPNAKFYAFGWDAYRTQATLNQVCQPFLRNGCRYGEGCYRIHPRLRKPPSDFFIKVKLAERPQAPTNQAPNSGERIITPNMRHGTHSDLFTVKLPRGLPQVSIVDTIQHTRGHTSAQPGQRHGVASEGSALNDRFNEGTSLNRSLTSERPGQDRIEMHQQSDSGQSSISCPSDSANSSPRMSSSQSSMTEELSNLTVTRKYPRPPPRPEACRQWILGRCSFGYACVYVHDDLNYDPPVKGSHPLPSEKCINWLRGRCHLGYACSYAHGDLEYTVLTPGVQSNIAPRPPTQITPRPPAQWSMTVDDHAKVTLGAGFEVKEVVTGFETPWIFIGGVPTHVTAAEITSLLESFGPVLDVRLPSISNSSSMSVKVRLSTSKLATQASITLNNTSAFGGTISARLPISNASSSVHFRDTAVRIQWEAPGKVGYGGYSSIEHARKAIAAARIPFRDNYVKASIHEGLPVVGVVTVRFRGVPIDANEGDMERFAHPDDIVWERPNYTSLPRAISGIKRIIEDHTELVSFDIIPAPFRGATVCAWVQFSTANEAQEACNRLHGRRPMFTGNTTIFARHVRSLGYSVAPALYGRIGADIEAFQMSVWRQNPTTTISIVRRAAPQTNLVKLSSEDLKELGRLKSEFEKILNGEVLRKDGKTAWDDFFVQPEGTAFLEAIKYRNPGVIIQLDPVRRILKLLGSVRNRGVVRRALLSKILSLQSQQVRTIALDGPLVGIFVISALEGLRQKIGGENVFLDLWNRNLRIRGDNAVFDLAQEAVHLARKHHRGHRSNVIVCPVCFDQVTAPITLDCGHTWCRSCLAGYLKSSIDNKYFPLTCLGDGAKCAERIPLNVAQEVLPRHDLDAIVHAAFSSHVQTRPEEFHYCPSPDCPQIYRKTIGGIVLQCPSCLLRICPCCHVEAHDGFVCPDADNGDNRFREWMREHDVKNCPGCKIPIERAEGCNHVTCTRCQTHICWECLETFPKGQGIYDHMRSVHGGIGVAPIEF